LEQIVVKDQPLNPEVDPNAVIVPLSPSLKAFLEKQANAEGITPAQLLIAAFLRTYNPRSAEDGDSGRP
jgi:hypothetical protein